jgi:hypothetical protein
MRLLKSHPILKLGNSYLVDSPPLVICYPIFMYIILLYILCIIGVSIIELRLYLFYYLTKHLCVFLFRIYILLL